MRHKRFVVNIIDCRAVSEPLINNTVFMQKAIDECRKHCGGTVYIPPGHFFSGTLRLYSNISLYLENGASLCALDEQESFCSGGRLRRGRLLIADDCHNIGIYGRGKIIERGQEELVI